MSESEWKALEIGRAMAALQRDVELRRKSDLARCLESWRGHVSRDPATAADRCRVQDREYRNILKAVAA